MKLDTEISRFLEAVAAGSIEVYNEFSLQHELGIFLRSRLKDYRVQFERNVGFFGLSKSSFEKKEIDIVVLPMHSTEPVCAIELKYPRNGQVPEQMFSFCKDIAFLEQLLLSGFTSAYFLALADDAVFYSGKGAGIYGFFRAGIPINGTITKPTGAKDKQVHVNGRYTASWSLLSGNTRACLVPVGS